MKTTLASLESLTPKRARPALFLAGLITATLIAAGCATGPSYPPAPRTAAGADYDYLIGPLDTVNIIVWRNPELSLSVPVRPDGKFSTPLIDELSRRARPPIVHRARYREAARKSMSATRSSPSSSPASSARTTSRSAWSAKRPSRSPCPSSNDMTAARRDDRRGRADRLRRRQPGDDPARHEGGKQYPCGCGT